MLFWNVEIPIRMDIDPNRCYDFIRQIKNSNFHEIVIIFIERVYFRRAHKSLSTKSAMREYLMHITARKRQTKYNFIDPFRSGEPERRIE